MGAELDVGAVQLWLAGGTNVYFERFDDQSVVARISQGAMAVRIRAWEQQDSMRVITQSDNQTAEISFLQPGFYVVSAASSYAPAAVTVRGGQAEARINDAPVIVNRGNSLVIDSSAGALTDTLRAPATAASRHGQALGIAAMSVTPAQTAVALINGW